MNDVHPLKRKSIRPSSSTVRGMLPTAQCKVLDAAMQSLRSTGLRLDWQWRGKRLGWACVAMYDEVLCCELLPTKEPLVGHVWLDALQKKQIAQSTKINSAFKNIIKFPLDEKKDKFLYEFPLESTPQRDLFANFIESLMPVFELSAMPALDETAY